MTTRYELQGRTDAYTSGWHPEVVSSDPSCTLFYTREEAEAALLDLIRFDPDSWHSDDLRVDEVERDDA